MHCDVLMSTISLRSCVSVGLEVESELVGKDRWIMVGKDHWILTNRDYLCIEGAQPKEQNATPMQVFGINL